MRRAVVLPLLTVACMRTGTLVSAVQLVPSTVPLAGQPYVVGDWASAEGCDYVDSDFSVAELVRQAQGDSHALVNVTVEQLTKVDYSPARSGRVVAVNAYCYRVRGQGVTLDSGSGPEAPGGLVAQPHEPQPLQESALSYDGPTGLEHCGGVGWGEVVSSVEGAEPAFRLHGADFFPADRGEEPTLWGRPVVDSHCGFDRGRLVAWSFKLDPRGFPVLDDMIGALGKPTAQEGGARARASWTFPSLSVYLTGHEVLVRAR